MAKRKHRQTRPAPGRKTGNQSTHRDRLLKIGVSIMVLGLLVFGAFQFIEPIPGQEAGAAAAIAANNEALEATSLEDGGNRVPVKVAAVTDRETRYLGPATDAAALAQAEAGEFGRPTLVWFHADW